MGGIIITTFWRDLKSYHVVWRGKNEGGVEIESCEIGRSEQIHPLPDKIYLVPWAICLLSFNMPPIYPPTIVCVRGQVKGYPETLGSLFFFNNSK